MATLYIAELSKVARLSNLMGDVAQASQVPPITEQTVAIGAGSVQSALFNPRTAFIRVNTDSTCSIAFGFNPTATTANMRLSANQTEFFGVYPGTLVAVIA